MTFTIRPAIESDQPIIVSFIHQAKINPRNLHWERFFIAEADGQPVGIRQVKIHAGGTREVASGFVLPEYRRQGIGAQLMNEILKREKGTLDLMCRDTRAPDYEKFGFRKVDINQLPPVFPKEYRIGRMMTTLSSILTGDRVRIIPMNKE